MSEWVKIFVEVMKWGCLYKVSHYFANVTSLLPKSFPRGDNTSESIGFDGECL